MNLGAYLVELPLVLTSTLGRALLLRPLQRVASLGSALAGRGVPPGGRDAPKAARRAK